MTITSTFCEHCGRANTGDTRFCASCGHQLGTYQVLPANQTGLLSSTILLKQRYRILSKLGQGGFGAVYLAQDTMLADAPRAIKEMSMQALAEEEVPQAIAAFKQEAQLLASMMHPHLPRVYDNFVEQERWYLIMDYIDGETLEKRLEKAPQGKLTVDDIFNLAFQLCTVLNYLHNRQPPIIFRDLKPGNIMLTTDNHLYLVDFGIARLFKPGQAKDTVSLGSPGYASPEQFGRAQTTAQSDIYSLGATLHHLLSGRDPGDDPFFFPPLDTNEPGPKGPGLMALIKHMTTLRREQRPANIQEVRDELENILAGKSTGSAASASTSVSFPLPSLSHRPALPPFSPSFKIKYTLTVAPRGGNYKSLADAVAAAIPGSRILVQPGTYLESKSIILDKTVEIAGQGPRESIIVGCRTGTTFILKTDQAWIHDLTISVDARNANAIDISSGEPVISNCTITSMRQACIDIHSPNANPLIRACRIRKGRAMGILVRDLGKGILEECEILEHNGPGIQIERGGKPLVRRCRISSNRSGGVAVRDSGEGFFEECDIANNSEYNVKIFTEGKPTFKDCKIFYDWPSISSEEQFSNVSVYNYGKGTLENCELSGSGTTGLSLSTGGNPTLHHCLITGAQTDGIDATDGSGGTLEHCLITENAGNGTTIRKGSWLVMQHCKLYRNGRYGIKVAPDSGGKIEQCEIFEHNGKSLELTSGHMLEVLDSRVE